MKDTRTAIVKIGFVVVIIAAAILYVQLIAPHLDSKISDLRMENKTIEHDVKAIDAMGGDPAAIEKQVAESQAKLDAIKAGASIVPDVMIADIVEKSDAAGLVMLEAAPSEPTEIGERTAYGVQLYSQQISLVFYGNYRQGAGFMESLEQSSDGIYRVGNFSFKNEIAPDAEGAGIVADLNDADDEDDVDDVDEADGEESMDSVAQMQWTMEVVLYYYSEQ
jgi:hypothetical protein